MVSGPLRTGDSPLPTDSRALRTAAQAGLLLAAPGIVAWATGLPAVFPSLGPSAYLLATSDGPAVAPRRVVGGHAVGVVAGLAAHAVLAPGLALAPADPLGGGWLRLATAAVASVALTAGGMELTDLEHAPACATTLIVSLGVLPTLADGAVVVGAVVVLVAVDAVLPAVGESMEGRDDPE